MRCSRESAECPCRRRQFGQSIVMPKHCCCCCCLNPSAPRQRKANVSWRGQVRSRHDDARTGCSVPFGLSAAVVMFHGSFRWLTDVRGSFSNERPLLLPKPPCLTAGLCAIDNRHNSLLLLCLKSNTHQFRDVVSVAAVLVEFTPHQITRPDF